MEISNKIINEVETGKESIEYSLTQQDIEQEISHWQQNADGGHRDYVTLQNCGRFCDSRVGHGDWQKSGTKQQWSAGLSKSAKPSACCGNQLVLQREENSAAEKCPEEWSNER